MEPAGQTSVAMPGSKGRWDVRAMRKPIPWAGDGFFFGGQSSQLSVVSTQKLIGMTENEADEAIPKQMNMLEKAKVWVVLGPRGIVCLALDRARPSRVGCLGSDRRRMPPIDLFMGPARHGDTRS